MLRDYAPTWPEAALVAACGAVLTLQLFMPPFVGLANNGDFPNVTGKFCLGPASNGWDDNFFHFVADYKYSPEYCWESEIASSEQPLAWLTTRIAGAFMATNGFDIRFMGLVHSAVFLTAYYIVLLALRPRRLPVRLGVGVFALFIFTDVCYASYFNSFYRDTAALLGLFLAVGLALVICVRSASAGSLIFFAIAALLVTTSKTQHALLGIPAAALLLLQGRKAAGRLRKILAFSLAGVTLACMAGLFLITPRFYTGLSLFNVVFHKITVDSKKPWQDLQELGFRGDDLQFVGMHAFSPESPANDPAWYREFQERARIGSLVKFYLAHPLRAARFLMDDLRLQAPNLRQENLSNFRRTDGRPPLARTGRFAAWSNLRRSLFLVWPTHIVLWYGLFMAGSAIMVYKRASPVSVRLGWLGLALSAAGIMEFGIASLADSVETDRHLLLFHAITDITFCFGLAASLTWLTTASTKVSLDKKRGP